MMGNIIDMRMIILKNNIDYGNNMRMMITEVSIVIIIDITLSLWTKVR